MTGSPHGGWPIGANAFGDSRLDLIVAPRAQSRWRYVWRYDCSAAARGIRIPAGAKPRLIRLSIDTWRVALKAMPNYLGEIAAIDKHIAAVGIEDILHRLEFWRWPAGSKVASPHEVIRSLC